MDFKSLLCLARRSKILLNVHRDDAPYLEWQRIVNIGILQKGLVISESSDLSAVLVPNLHYVEAPLNAVAALCEHYLAKTELAEQLVSAAYDDFITRCRLDDVLRALLSNVLVHDKS